MERATADGEDVRVVMKGGEAVRGGASVPPRPTGFDDMCVVQLNPPAAAIVIALRGTPCDLLSRGHQGQVSKAMSRSSRQGPQRGRQVELRGDEPRRRGGIRRLNPRAYLKHGLALGAVHKRVETALFHGDLGGRGEGRGNEGERAFPRVLQPAPCGGGKRRRPSRPFTAVPPAVARRMADERNFP